MLFSKPILVELLLLTVFHNTSGKTEKKTDTSLFVKKPYLRYNYIESKIEEDFDLKKK